MSLWVVLALVVALVLLFRAGGDAHTVVELDGDRLTVTRGQLPPALARELRALGLTGPVRLRGRGERLAIDVDGLDDGPAQRVRNVVFGFRTQLR